MITDKQHEEIRAYVKTLDLGTPSAEAQQTVVRIFRKYAQANNLKEQEES